MMQTQRVVMVVHGNELQEVGIAPGTTAADVLNEIGVPNSYWISGREGRAFAKDEDIFHKVQDGQRLFVSAPADVAV